MMIKDQKFISLDLELTQPTRKIIQVGVCIGSPFQSEEEFVVKKWYIDPNEEITQQIIDLTGITNEDIKNKAQPIADIAKELSDLIVAHKCFVNPVSWGGGDSEELLDLFKQNNVEFKHFGRRWVDVKTIHTFLEFSSGSNKPTGGLSSSMGKYKLQFIGKAHRADVDAYNTLRFFFALLERQESFNGIVMLAKGIK